MFGRSRALLHLSVPNARKRDPILQGSHLISRVNQHLIS